jgi:hypothetical protein
VIISIKILKMKERKIVTTQPKNLILRLMLMTIQTKKNKMMIQIVEEVLEVAVVILIVKEEDAEAKIKAKVVEVEDAEAKIKAKVVEVQAAEEEVAKEVAVVQEEEEIQQETHIIKEMQLQKNKAWFEIMINAKFNQQSFTLRN